MMIVVPPKLYFSAIQKDLLYGRTNPNGAGKNLHTVDELPHRVEFILLHQRFLIVFYVLKN
jgi:hypothetical protein